MNLKVGKPPSRRVAEKPASPSPVPRGLGLPLIANLPADPANGRQPGLVEGIIEWAEQLTPLKLSFDDLTGIQRDVSLLKVNEEHEMHVCKFCLFAKKSPAGLKDCRRNKHAVNWLIFRRQRGLAGYCHLGLLDMVEPLVIDGRVLGVFYFGSVVVKGKGRMARERILRYCKRRDLDPAPYLKLLLASPVIHPREIPVHQNFLRSLAALATQCCRAAGIRAGDYRPMVQAIKYRPHAEMPYLVKAAIRYVHEHLGEPFTVKDIAAHLRCHPNFLSKQFKKHLQIELANYTSSMRITHATQIMENPKLSISQVADESGFSDRVYFGKVFRRATGKTPGQYRQHLASLGKFPKSNSV